MNQEYKKGWYSKPHYLIDLVQDKVISKSAYLLLDLLLHFENRFQKQGKKFECADTLLCKARLISPKTLIGAKRELKKKGFIEYTSGNSHKPTVYKIQINQQDYWKSD